MDRAEESRLVWQRAQAALKESIAALEQHVASSTASPESIEEAHEALRVRRQVADEMLARHITQLGKSQ